MLGEKLERWRERLANTTELILPTDYPRPIPQKMVEAELVQDISDTTSLAILQLALQFNRDETKSETCATPFSIILAAFAILLQKFTGEDDITVGSSSTSQNPLILRMPISASASFKEILQVVISVFCYQSRLKLTLPTMKSRFQRWSIIYSQSIPKWK